MALHARSWILAATLLLAFAPASLALRAAEGLDALDDREREVLEAIASRAPKARSAALVATQHPDVLVRIELIHARSAAAFDLRVQRLDREHQEELWELVRTPGALADVVAGGRPDAAALDAIAGRHPAALRDTIRHLGDEHFDLLQEADAIKASADIQFGEEIARLPEPARQAFVQLLEDPELLAMLARSPRALVAIGEAFAADPEATRARIDELAIEVAAANEAVEEEWREALESDPEARAELEQAAHEYADEYAYAYDDLTSEEVRVSVRHYYAPYPYWFGYPSWYAHWAPWGWWYPVYPHIGFYHGYQRHHVSFGLPSLHFVHWFYGGHHHRYTHVARHFDHRRHGHHRSSHAVYRTVRRHERHGQWRAHRHGSPETIDGRSFRSRDGHRRELRGTRRGEFRSRALRMPDRSFGRRFDRERRRSDPGGRDERAHRRDRNDGGRVDRVDRLPRVDAPRRTERRGRSIGESRNGPRVARPNVTRPNVARPNVARPDVTRRAAVRPGRSGGPTRVDRTPSSPTPPARAERTTRAPRVERSSEGRRSASARRAESRGERAAKARSRSPAFKSKGRSHSAGRSRAVASGGRSGRSSGGPRMGGGGSRGRGGGGAGHGGRGGRGGGGRGGRH